MRVSIPLCLFMALIAVTFARPMGGGGPGFKGPQGPKFNSSQLFGCTGDCTPETFKNCTGTCNVQISGLNATLPVGFNSTKFPRPDALPQLSGCTGGCNTTNFPVCSGACIATLNSTARVEGGKFNGTRPTFQLSACTGNCTETNFPKCVGSCVAASNITTTLPSGITRPAMPGVSGCLGGCTETTFPICVGSCVVAANMTKLKPPHRGPGGGRPGKLF